MSGDRPLLEIDRLRVTFGRGERAVAVVDDLSLSLERGRTLALLGESGSGKTMTALAVTRLLPAAARVRRGRVVLDGVDLLALPESAMRSLRGRRVAMLFQEPQTALNPVLTIGQQIGETLARDQRDRGARQRRVLELLEAVGIPDPDYGARCYPHQFSGGMKQRAMLAIALCGEPELLIADEPTTALDVTIQAQVLELLQGLQRETGMAMLFITHDLAVAARMADAVAVMKGGVVLEQGDTAKIYRRPRHAYTRALFDALPERRPRAAAAPAGGAPLLRVDGLKVYYPVKRGILRRAVDHVRAVDDVSLQLRAAETLAVVGESGSGKTTLGKSLLRLLRPHGGGVTFDGAPLAQRARRADLQIVFQDPYASMNPRMLIADVIAESMPLERRRDPARRAARVAELLEQVGLESAHQHRYPHEFSGGQRQRVCIARALASDPRLIVCDEPTSSLDLSVQAQIIDLLLRLQQRLGLAYLFITHDLGVVRALAHRVAVMRQGKIVEHGDAGQILDAPRHPYTRQLLAALPEIGEIPGETPAA